MEKNKTRSDCPISCSLDMFGDKWSLLIMRDMMFANKNTYGDFLKSAEGIATNILASRLQALEEHQFITRLEHPDSKVKVLYKLTQKAIDLLPIIVEIYTWAEKHLEIPTEIKAMVKDAKKDKPAFVKKMTKELKKQIAA